MPVEASPGILQAVCAVELEIGFAVALNRVESGNIVGMTTATPSKDQPAEKTATESSNMQ
jgi:hypothetical protein